MIRCDTANCEWEAGHQAEHPCGQVAYDDIELPSPDEAIARLYSQRPSERRPYEIVLVREVERLRSPAEVCTCGPGEGCTSCPPPEYEPGGERG